MKIKIVEENAEKIEAALKAVNGRATGHTFTDFSSIEEVAEKAEEALDDLDMPASYRRGARYCADSGSPVANAYQSARKGTHITIERGTKGWYLVAVETRWLYPDQGGQSWLYLTEGQDEALVKRLRRNYTIQKPVLAEAG
jgi:hypothetical protein